MPDLNSQGVPLYARGFAYLTQTDVIGQVCGLEGCRIVSGPSAGPFSQQADRGCNAITASHGRWLAFLSGYGVFGPDGLMGAEMSLGCDIQATRGIAGPDGTIAVILHYQQGRGLRLVHPDGSWVDYPDVYPQAQVAVIDRTRALFVSSRTGQVETVGGLPVPSVRPGGCWWPAVVAVGDEWWICYHGDDGIFLHPFDSLTGYRLPQGFYPVARAIGGSRVAMAWAHGADDASGDVRVIDCAVEPRVSLASEPLPIPTDPTPYPEIPMPDSLEDAVRAERAKYPTPLVNVNDYATILNTVAWNENIRLGSEEWGLSVKPQGNHVLAPQIYTEGEHKGEHVPVAYDILHNRPTNTLWGCFGDNGVNWGLEQYHGDPDGRPWLAPIAPSGGGDDGDPGDEDDGDSDDDEQPPVCADCKDLKEKVAWLNDTVTRFMEASGETFDAMQTAIETLQQKPEPSLPELVARGKVYGLKVELPVVRK